MQQSRQQPQQQKYFNNYLTTTWNYDNIQVQTKQTTHKHNEKGKYIMILTGKALFIYKMKKIHDFIAMISTSALFVAFLFAMVLMS